MRLLGRTPVTHALTLAVVLATVPSTLGTGAARVPVAAGAHICALPVEVAVDEPATLTIGVGAESTAVTGVQIEVPDGFRLTDASGDGWQVETDDDVVRFTGGSIAPFACAYVTLRGVAEERAEMVFPLVMETAAGESVRYDSDEPYLEESAQLVYAGMEIPARPESDDGGVQPLTVAGLVLMAFGLLLAGWFGYGWWRSRSADSD